MIPLLTLDMTFPALDKALNEPNGLLAAGGDLSPERLLAAYKQGVFPWFNEDDPILWWSPDPRMVLFPNELKVSRSLNKTLKKENYKVCVDSDFFQVMQACAEPRKGQAGTWVHSEMIAAYVTLHDMGLAHSVEVWQDNRLIGGLYGIAIGKMFFGESMFSRETDASKIAFVHLVRQLQAWGFGMIDCQMKTLHLASFGAREVPRKEFSQKLDKLVIRSAQAGKWQFDYNYNE